MKTILIFGTTTVILALTSYSIAVITEQRKKIVSKFVLIFLIIGVLLDISATAMMIIGSSAKGITFHGLLGYSALLAMLIDAILLIRLKNKNGFNSSVPKKVHLYSRFAYSWWVIAFITGSLLVALR
ncbi:MAG: hypothetical protein GXO79_01055 [Chlorobi bacterium]|nr:hypothetical protein [Chlorobiota bacterium]